MIDVVELENSKTPIDLFQSTNPTQIMRWKFWGDTEHMGNKNKQCHVQNLTMDEWRSYHPKLTVTVWWRRPFGLDQKGRS